MRTFLYLAGKYATVMQEVDLKAYNFPWHIQNPSEPNWQEHKNDAKDHSPLAIFGTIVDEPELDSATETGLPRRIGANLKSLYALQLDYDSGLSIDEFINGHKDLQYSLYTSYSHGQREHDRFRVVVPLKQELPCELLESRKVRENLMWHFPGVDESCFHRGHWQLLPLVNTAYKHLYRWHRNAGSALELDIDGYRKMKEAEEREREERLRKSLENIDDKSQERIRAWLVEQLAGLEVGAGTRYVRVKSLLAWAMNNGLGDAVLSIDCPWPTDKKWQKRWGNLVEWAATLC